MREDLDRQWKIDMEHYLDVILPQWEAERVEIDAD